jgi:hypothetical protein
VEEKVEQIKQKYAFSQKFYDTEIIKKDGIISNIIHQKKKKETK